MCYTQLATPIYNSLVALYTKMVNRMNIKRVSLVVPYAPLGQGVCFDANVLESLLRDGVLIQVPLC